MKLKLGETGRAMNWILTTDRTAWEAGAAVAVLLAAAVGASAFLKTSKIVAVFRFFFLLTAALLFFDPILTRRVEEKPTVLLTLDDSASLRRPLSKAVKDGGKTVWTRCVQGAKEAESAARRRGFPVELRTLSGRSVASFAELERLGAPSSATSPLLERGAGGPTSRLDEEGKGPDRRGRERILLFSDGIQNSGAAGTNGGLNESVVGEKASAAVGVVDGERSGASVGDVAEEKAGAAVDAVAVGVSTGTLDWRWGAVDAPSTLYPGGVATLRADLRLGNGASEITTAQGDKRFDAQKKESVRAQEKGGLATRKEGRDETRRAVVRLWESPVERGVKGTARLVWERNVDVEIGKDGAATFRVEREWAPERDGVFDYFLFVADIEDAQKTSTLGDENALFASAFELSEFCALNNAATFRVVAKKGRLKVLLIDDEPRYEYRYLRELLRREEGVELKTLLFSADDATRDGDPTAFSFRDFTRRRLAEFDAILVGDVPFERWGGKARALADVATQEGSETSIWLLGGEKTAEVGENGESLTGLLGISALNWEKQGKEDDWGKARNGEDGAGGDASLDSWRLVPTARGLDVFAGAAPWGAALEAGESGEAGDGVEFWRVSENTGVGIGTETLFNARRRSDGREVPLFVVATLGKNKVLAQGTDELWRLRTLGDKTVYRRFVLRALEFLTDETAFERDAESGGAAFSEEGTKERELTAASEESFFDSWSGFRKIKGVGKKRAALAAETADVAARLDVLQEIATTTGGETLDLRDLDESAARDAAKAFFERRFDEYSPVVVERSRRLVPKNGLFALLFLLGGVVWGLERRLEAKRGV